MKSAPPIAPPGWPDFAFSTIEAARTRMLSAARFITALSFISQKGLIINFMEAPKGHPVHSGGSTRPLPQSDELVNLSIFPDSADKKWQAWRIFISIFNLRMRFPWFWMRLGCWFSMFRLESFVQQVIFIRMLPSPFLDMIRRFCSEGIIRKGCLEGVFGRGCLEGCLHPDVACCIVLKQAYRLLNNNLLG